MLKKCCSDCASIVYVNSGLTINEKHLFWVRLLWELRIRPVSTPPGYCEDHQHGALMTSIFFCPILTW